MLVHVSPLDKVPKKEVEIDNMVKIMSMKRSYTNDVANGPGPLDICCQNSDIAVKETC